MPSRTMAESADPSGSETSLTVLPTHFELSGSVNSTRFAFPVLKEKSRTTSPTVTASSTRAAIIRGVDTATSIPQEELKSHSFLGCLIRATTRGTPYSDFARSEETRLTLSSPVAATMTWQVSRPALLNEEISQASASSHSASGTLSIFSAFGSLSIKRT